ncbi:MAG: hypothetical protein ABII90_15825 [Bacteroidota bacterium]
MNVPVSFCDRPFAKKHFLAIVDYASKNNPFYRNRFTDSGELPIIDRITFLEHNDEILNNNPVTASTSGSTGIPVRISVSAERDQMNRDDDIRFVRWLGGPLPCTRIIHSGSDDKRAWLLDVKAPIDEQIAFIQRRYSETGAVALTTYPTNAEMLAREVLDRGIDMSFIQRFGVFSEAFETYQKEVISRAFPNSQIWSTYSSMEFGMIAGQCPYEPDYHHIMAHKLGVEILNKDDEKCKPGEMGRLVITDYFNRQSPLIRYEIGDYAIGQPCPCERIKLPAFRKIVGKVRGALIHRGGRRVVFTALSVALRDLPGMRQYQVIQDNIEDFTVKIAASQQLDDEIRLVFNKHFGYIPKLLKVQYVNSIPREANGKFHASICMIK